MEACAIPDIITDSVFITGGGYHPQTVSRYDLQGWVEDLPQLIDGRDSHGCGSYLRVDGTQVLLVAGGAGGGHGSLSSTEVLTGDSPAWTKATPLPRALGGLRGISLDNIVYMTGGDGTDFSDRAEILAWND